MLHSSNTFPEEPFLGEAFTDLFINHWVSDYLEACTSCKSRVNGCDFSIFNMRKL